MTKKMDEIYDSINDSYVKNLIISLKEMGYTDETFNNLYQPELEDIMIKSEPVCYRSLIALKTTIIKFCKFMEDYDTISRLNNMDMPLVWEKCKALRGMVFIPNSEFEDGIKNILENEEYNALYYATFIKCIYEGVNFSYGDSIANLRRSDICDDYIIIRPDNKKEYKFNVSDTLKEYLIKLSYMTVWKRDSGHDADSELELWGIYEDSCFKIGKNGSEEQKKMNKYKRLKSIYRTRVAYVLKKYFPLYESNTNKLYYNGIIYRICVRLKEFGYENPINYIVKKEEKDELLSRTIRNELERCGSNIKIGRFREIALDCPEAFSDI